MKFALTALAALALASAGAATASPRVTDVDYLQASRCKGLAQGLGAATAGLDSFLKAEARNRDDVILQRGQDETARAKRQTRDADLKDRLSAELSGACSAYMATPTAMTGR